MERRRKKSTVSFTRSVFRGPVWGRLSNENANGIDPLDLFASREVQRVRNSPRILRSVRARFTAIVLARALSSSS